MRLWATLLCCLLSGVSVVAAAPEKVSLTADQRKAMGEARKAAAADGKKGKAIQEAIRAAVNLSWNVKPVPMQRGGLVNSVGDVEGECLALLHPQNRA